MNLVTYLFTVAVMAASVGFAVRGFDTRAVLPLRPAPDGEGENGCRASRVYRPAPMTRGDVLPLGLICLVYAALAFIGLGDFAAPQSFYKFRLGDGAVLELEKTADVSRLYYYTGADVGTYALEFSRDGEVWLAQAELEQKYSEVLKWHEVEFDENADGVRFIRIYDKRSASGLSLGEVALFDAEGRPLAFSTRNALTDEQELVPSEPSYLNSTYFDEIYHVRTAWEHIQNVSPYEISHPPLGKLIISLGIRLFGLVPFGWRFMGVVFGILMLPLMYLFIKNLFGGVLVAACGTAVFAFDFMHFVQTRIATIDTYGVFFILLMYYFMYLYFVQPYDAPLRKTLPRLFLSGLSFGLGAACKWTVVYGGAGLAVLWLVRQLLCLSRRSGGSEGKTGACLRRMIPTVLCSILFFIVIPAVVYISAYIPYAAAKGMKIFSLDYLKLVWDNQKYMFSYHSGLEATHPYEARWWKWPIDLRPILYYLKYYDDGTKAAFGAFGNPLFWWTGLGAMICMLVKTLRGDGLALLIAVGYLSSLLPWVFISRCAFVYHYFPCTVFLALALAYMFGDLRGKAGRGAKLLAPAFAGLCLLLFAIFYPVLTGVRFSQAYTNTLLRWFGGQWPF